MHLGIFKPGQTITFMMPRLGHDHIGAPIEYDDAPTYHIYSDKDILDSGAMDLQEKICLCSSEEILASGTMVRREKVYLCSYTPAEIGEYVIHVRVLIGGNDCYETFVAKVEHA